MSTSPKTLASKFEETQQTLLNLAVWVAAYLRAREFDCIIVLAHGGLAPLWALERHWELTQTAPLPPVVIANFGNEKFSALREVMRDFDPIGWPLMGCMIGPIETQGYALHWVSQQWFWQTELRGMVEAATGGNAEPKRILVFDECQFEGTTILLFNGLLHDLYPDDPLLLLWDRASWHGGEPVRQVLAANPRLEALKLPVAAPQLNPQEQVWKATRRAISHNHGILKLPCLAHDFEKHLTGTVFPTTTLKFHGYHALRPMFE